MFRKDGVQARVIASRASFSEHAVDICMLCVLTLDVHSTRLGLKILLSSRISVIPVGVGPWIFGDRRGEMAPR